MKIKEQNITSHQTMQHCQHHLRFNDRSSNESGSTSSSAYFTCSGIECFQITWKRFYDTAMNDNDNHDHS